MSLKILFFGATGYLGGPALLRLLKDPKRDTFDITVFIRDTSKARGFEALGVKTAIGSFSDLDLLERLSSETDVVFQHANCDDFPATQAILRGLKKRFDNTGTAPAFIHTSGTGVLVDDAEGRFSTETIYSDLDITQIESLPVTQMHRDSEIAIAAAGEEGYTKTFVVVPSTIWGIASNELTEKGLQNPISRQIPDLITISLKRGRVPLLGEGANIWPHVELEETVDFYTVLFDAILSGKNPAQGREGYYFLENGEYSQRQLNDAVARHLFQLGKVDSTELTHFTEQELVQNPTANYAGTNSRCRADRSRALGWKPTKTTKDFIANLATEIDYLLKRNQA